MRYDYTIKCRGCGQMCDGTMRQIAENLTPERYEAVRLRIEEQAPKTEAGEYALCHTCQRMCDKVGIERNLLMKFTKLANRLYIAENFKRGNIGGWRLGTRGTGDRSPY